MTLGLLTVPAAFAGSAAAAPVPAPAAALADQAGTYRAVTQLRVLDSRSGIGGPRAALAPGEIRTVKVAGVGSLPATGISAVAVNVGVLGPARSGSVTVFPGGTGWNRVGSISFPAGGAVQSSLTAKLGSTGTLALRNNTGVPLQLIADVTGYYLAGTPTAAGAFGALSLARLLDTRSGIGGPATAVAPGQTRTVQVSGRGGVPATGVSAVAVNVGVLGPARSGAVAVFPGHTAWSGMGSISFIAGVTVQSSLTAKLGADGTLAVRNNTGVALQLIADVSGYYRAGTPTAKGAYRPVSLIRALDTRRPDSSAIRPGATLEFDASRATAADGGPVAPVTGVMALSANVGVLGPLTAGSISVFPGTRSWNGTGSISFPARVTVQSSLTTTLGVTGTLLIRNNTAADLQVIVDVAGYYLGQPAPADFGAAEQIDPMHGVVESLSCPSASFCAGVETNGYALVSDGRNWSAPEKLPKASGLSSVSCARSTFCVAVGRSTTGGGVAYTFDGRSWSVPAALSNYDQATAVSCPTTAFCMVVDIGGGAQSYDGTGWSPRTQIAGSLDLRGLSCVSSTFCVALDMGASAAMFDGVSWSVVAARTSADSFSRRKVSCASPTFCVAAGFGAVSIYDGTRWSEPDEIAPYRPLDDVSCTSASFCAVTNKNGRVLTFDGTSWTSQVVIPTGQVNMAAVSCASPTYCIAGYYGMTQLAYRYDGSSWGDPVFLDHTYGIPIAVSCTARDFCMMMDWHGGARSYTASGWGAWSDVDPKVPVSSLSCTSSAFCVAVDAAGQAVSYTGSGWGQPVVMDGARRLTSVSCASTTSCVAVDVYGWAVSYDNGAWSEPTRIDTSYLRAVSCASPRFCVAVDDLGRALTRVGTVWSQPTGTPLTSADKLSCPSPSFCVATSTADGSYYSASRVAVFDGHAWSAVPANVYENLVALSCPAAGTCVGIDQNQLSVGFDGANWSRSAGLPPYPLGSVSDISCVASGFCMAVSVNGYATHTA